MPQCPVCDQDHDDDWCCGSDDHKHAPDWSSTTTQYDGDQLYVDVNCRHCGRSGCVGTHETLAENINW